ncbi:MAG: MATE family efflux transporter [Lachnospiraceae bacterium]|nr:MATE family efflux transporter [Lachnospiraceae bacterium]
MQKKQTKSQTLDMTQGSIVKLLIAFSIPLLLGNLFQQLYNTVDSLVVGNFVGKEALAAVGSTTPVINTLVMFFGGVAVGASVIISRYFGAHDDEKLHLAVETTMALTFVSSIICTVLGVVIAPALLRFMDTPEDVLPQAAEYLEIYFAGVSGLLIYNMGSGILRAVGDTKRPLYFLILSSIMNIVLDLVFVINFNMGIAGVAYATIISQFVSSILVLIILTKSTENYRFVWKDMRFDKSMMSQIFTVGLPVGLQQALTSFSNVYVQSYINSFGSSCMAGWSSYVKIDSFLMLPLQSMASASTTFASQNIGAGNLKRVKEGTIKAIGLSCGVIFVFASILWVFAPQMVALFNKDPEVIYYGVLFLRLCVFMVMICCPTQMFAGTLRGAGDAKSPMFIMLFSYVVFRQIYLYIVNRFFYSPYTIGFGYPAGWFVCAVLMALSYKFSGWDKKLKMDH